MHETPPPRPGEPTLSQVIRDAISSRLLDVHTSMPTKVVSYNKTKQTAELEPQIFGVIGNHDGDLFLETLPNLVNVPIGWFRAGGASFQMRLVPGDYVEVIFNEASWALWRTTGVPSEPGDLTRHGLSYPLGLPCIGPDSAALTAIADTEAAVLDGTGFIRMGGPSADFVALAAKVDTALVNIKTWLAAHTHPVPGVTTGPGATTSSVAALAPPVTAPTGTVKLKGE